MEWLEKKDTVKPLVHIIDREADSFAHFRQWKDKNWLVRIKSGSSLNYNKQRLNARQIAESLDFHHSATLKIDGKTACQWVGEADVVVDRPARQKNKNEKGSKPVPGEHLDARLVVSRIIDDKGEILADWFLLSNMKKIPPARIALWY